MFVVVRQLYLLSDYGEMRAGLDVRLLLLKSIRALGVVQVIFWTHNRLVSSAFLLEKFVDYVAFDVLAHVLVNFTNSAWWTGPATALLLDFIDPFFIVGSVVPSAAFITGLDVGTQPHSIDDMLQPMRYLVVRHHILVVVGEVDGAGGELGVVRKGA